MPQLCPVLLTKTTVVKAERESCSGENCDKKGGDVSSMSLVPAKAVNYCNGLAPECLLQMPVAALLKVRKKSRSPEAKVENYCPEIMGNNDLAQKQIVHAMTKVENP